MFCHPAAVCSYDYEVDHAPPEYGDVCVCDHVAAAAVCSSSHPTCGSKKKYSKN